jgi:hypothetical protein
MSGCVGKVTSILLYDQLGSMNRLWGKGGSHIQLSLEKSKDDNRSNLVCAMTEDTDGRFRWGIVCWGRIRSFKSREWYQLTVVNMTKRIPHLTAGPTTQRGPMILDNVLDFKGWSQSFNVDGIVPVLPPFVPPCF